MNRRNFCIAGAGMGALTMRGPAFAGDKYPARPISYVVPVAAGGGSDYVARATTTLWGKALGATFVVENLGGGGGVIACQKTRRADPDGYTLLQGYVATLGTSPATRRVPYDPIKDFTPIAMIGGTPNVLVVDAALPVRNFQEFVGFMKAGGPHNYGSAGAGTLSHLLMEMLKAKLGIAPAHVSYKGIAPAINDLLGGQTQAMFPGLAAAVPHLSGGKLRALAVTGEQRTKRYPDIPTFKELGIGEFDDVLQWYGVSGPAGMASSTVAALNETLGKVLLDPELEKLLAVEAVVPMRMTPGEFDAYVRKDLARWTRLAQAQNIRLDA